VNSRMGPKFRWTHPQNFRSQDKALLDASLDIAQRERTDLTNVIRRALQEYVAHHSEREMSDPRLDEFIKDPMFKALPSISRILTPKELGEWGDESLLLVARNVRARKMELDGELKRRGFLQFMW
jgi:hypothetical protein